MTRIGESGDDGSRVLQLSQVWFNVLCNLSSAIREVDICSIPIL